MAHRYCISPSNQDSETIVKAWATGYNLTATPGRTNEHGFTQLNFKLRSAANASFGLLVRQLMKTGGEVKVHMPDFESTFISC